MIQRALLTQLKSWREKSERKPLLIDGARQTGKTYLLEKLFAQDFPRVLRIDFLEMPHMAEAFAGSLSPHDIISNLELLTGQEFNLATDLLLLDEIGECERAVASLKYFAENTPQAFVAASGSNIGLLNSFPVGKVEQHVLRPLTFHEFLSAAQEPAVLKAYEQEVNSAAAHSVLLEKLSDYYFTGGMPEAVSTWFALKEQSILQRIKAVQQIHGDLISGYQRDFGKYAGKVDANLIAAVFNAIPAQLSLLLDESVKRFKFKEVYQKKSRYKELEDGILWLANCRLALRNYPIEGLPRSPLAAYQKENRIKLFMFDVGLLNHMLGLSYQEIKQQSFEYKGYIAENFVQQELAALGIDPSFSWTDARAEIEFIQTDMQGNIIPIEVKSGKRTRARSLESYIQKCAPIKAIKLTATQGSSALEKEHLVYPLYFTAQMAKTHLLNYNP